MATLLYAPSVTIRISTQDHGIVDVSEDIVTASVNLAEDQMSSLNFTLNNARRKYDGVFTPNDRVVVRMKRVTEVQVFSGYLNSVPFRSIFPRQVPLTASCTLKRLMYRYWDPGSEAAVALLDSTGNGAGFQQSTDGGIRDRLMRMLTEVAEWPEHAIHIGAIPGAWLDKVANLQEQLASRVIVDPASLGVDTTIAGRSLTSLGTMTVPGAGLFTGVLPATNGKVSWFGGPGGGATGKMALTGESGVSPRDPWYVAMRWPYQSLVNGTFIQHGTPQQRSKAIAWWRDRKILVVSPQTNKAVVLRAADWGPGGIKAADNRAIDVSPKALEELRLPTDARVEIRFADPSLPLGPVSEANRPVLRRTDPLGEPHPILAPAMQVQGPTGVTFVAKDNLKPHVAAARQFAEGAWPELRMSSGYRDPVRNAAVGGVRNSDHVTGHALDFSHGGGNTPNATQAARATSLAAWFIQNPNAFGTKYVIWQNRIIYGDGKGWRPYTAGGHLNHVHVSFKTVAQGAPTSLGPSGSPWVGADMPGFPSYEAVEGAGGVDTNLINSFLWYSHASEGGAILSGIRALMNDTPILNSIQTLANASMRSFMAGPNGDFIAWFPDYFGTYRTAGRMIIKDIEMVGDGFTMTWDDARLKTHMYVTGTWDGAAGSTSSPGGPVGLYEQLTTAGIATVEYPEIMEALFNISADDPRARDFLNAETILQRFGARPEVLNLGEISGPQAEFWAALHHFQRNWARQFSARVELAFMPEVYPGMLLYLEDYGLQVYVTGVNHTCDFQSGFRTDVTVVSPSGSNGSGLFGLPRADGV